MIVDDILYLANSGEGTALLKRNNRVVKLLDKGENVSGVLKQGDLLMITSDSFNKIISKDIQKEIILQNSFSQIPEKLEPLLISSPDSSGSIALIIQFTQAYSQAPLPEVIIPPTQRTNPPPRNRTNLKETILSRLNLANLIEKDDYPASDTEVKSKKTLATIAIILILLLVASIFLSISKGVSKEKLDNYNKNIDLVSHKLDEADSLIDLNPLRARTLLSDSRAILISLEDFPDDTDESKNIQKLLSRLKDQEFAATKVYKLTDVPLYFDTTLLRKDGSGSSLAIYEDTIAILDSKNKVIYTLSASSKQSQILAGASIVKDAKLITIHGDQIYILNSESVASIDLTSKASKVVIKKDDSWGQVGAIAAFAGNIYLLDKGSDQIGKYIRTDEGFSQKYNYLTEDIRPDLENTPNMSIDGSIWLVSKGEITKFTQGRFDNFKPQGLLGNISASALIFTNDESKKVYVLDPNKGSIIVLAKDGNYEATYEWPQLKKSTSFVVTEKEKKIFILLGSKIYAIELK